MALEPILFKDIVHPTYSYIHTHTHTHTHKELIDHYKQDADGLAQQLSIPCPRVGTPQYGDSTKYR